MQLRSPALHLFALALGLARASSALPASLDYDQLVKLIQNNRVRSIDQLLPLLPDELRRQYVLMYKSRSTLQGASPENPRVMLYGKDAKLMLTFNGDASQKGYNNLEVMQFKESTKQFEMREIVFPDPANSQRVVAYSRSNPDQCIKCHQSPPRPVWDTYSSWPGAFGSADGEIHKGSAEDRYYQSFLQRVAKTPNRYATLQLPVRKNETTQSYGLAAEGVGKSGNLNFNFTNAISELNFQRITAELQAAPYFERVKYAVLAIANRCIGKQGMKFEDLVPPGIVAASGSRPTFEVTKRATAEAQKAYFRDKYDRSGGANPSGEGPLYEFNEDQLEEHAGLRHLMLSQGRDIQNWFTSLETVSNTFGYSSQWFELWSGVLTPALLESEPELRGYFSFSRDSDYGGNDVPFGDMMSDRREAGCNLLKAKSLAALTGPGAAAPALRADSEGGGQPLGPNPNFASPRDAAALVAAPRALQSCLECHTGTDPDGPAIPFDDEATLRKALNAPPLMDRIIERLHRNGPGKMPKGSDLNAEERNQLEDYLRGLTKKPPPLAQ